MKYRHEPVLLVEVLKNLKCRKGNIVIDCTLGGAGHAKKIAELIAPDGILVGIELDDVAINVAKQELAHFGQQIKVIRDSYKNLDKILIKLGLGQVDAFLFDLGVSSLQLDDPERGFSYRFDSPLDMRMDRRSKLTAREVVNTYSEEELASVLRRYGEEKFASKIAHFIVERRRRKKIVTTGELVKVIKDAIPAHARRGKPHPAKRTFQALRIEVNKELEGLEQSIKTAVNWLKVGGRVAVITYHSLEDRLIKKTFKDLARGCICPPEIPICRCGLTPLLKIITAKPIRPTKEEIEINPRSRSAKLRVGERI